MRSGKTTSTTSLTSSASSSWQHSMQQASTHTHVATMLSRFVKRDWKNLMRNKRDIIEGKRLRDHYKLDHVYKSVEELYDFEKSLVGAMAEHEWEMEKKKREWAKKDALFRRAKTAWEQEALRDLAGDKVDTEQGKVGTQVAFGEP